MSNHGVNIGNLKKGEIVFASVQPASKFFIESLAALIPNNKGPVYVMITKLHDGTNAEIRILPYDTRLVQPETDVPTDDLPNTPILTLPTAEITDCKRPTAHELEILQRSLQINPRLNVSWTDCVMGLIGKQDGRVR